MAADTTPPSVAISSPVATGGTYNTSTATVNVSGTASDNVGVVYVYVANNRGGAQQASGLTSWTATGVALQPGTNILTVHALDFAANDATTSITVNYTATVVDTTPPSVAISSPVATGGTYNTSTATVNVSGTASDNVGVGIVIWDNNRGGGGTASGTTNWSATGIALQSGANIITVHAYDAAGNTQTASITVNYTTVVDVPPTLSFTATPGSITSGQSSTLSWSSTNATSCTASGGWTGAKSVSGSEVVSPSSTTIYTLSCSGTGGGVTQSATVNYTTVTTGNLTVTVRHSDTNALLSGATVTLSGGPSSPAPQTTASDGTTTFLSLPVGNYTVMVSLAEFKTNSASATVVANTPTPVAVSLTPSQELTPPPQPPEPLVDTTGATTPTDRAVVITHGWHDDAKTWVTEMAAAICKDLGFNGSLQPPVDNQAKIMCHAPGVSGGLGWDVWVKDWKDGANEFEPWDAVTNATGIGEKLAFTLNKGNYQHIHFVAHSAGANLIETASRWLKVFRPTRTIHETFLDAYDPERELSLYGMSADVADHYVDTRDVTPEGIGDATRLTLMGAYNIDVTPSIAADLDCSTQSGTPYERDKYRWSCRHSRPYRFYGLSIDDSFVGYGDFNQSDPIWGTAMGYPLSLENHLSLDELKQKLPHGGKCYVEFGLCVQDSLLQPTSTHYLAAAVDLAVDDMSTTVDYVEGAGAYLFNSITMWVTGLAPQQMLAVRDSTTSGAATEAPSYLVVNVTTTTPANTLRFNWSFAAGGEGLLRVFVGGNLVREIDQRYVTPSSPETEDIYIGSVEGPLPPGVHRITFRLDGFGASANGVELTDVDLGLRAAASPTLTVTKAGTGTGTVTSAPTGIDCGTDCSESYANGTPVSLTAIPGPGSIFVGWGGDCNSSGQVTLDAAKTCTATFTATVVGPLTISTTSPPAGEQGAAYGYALLAEGGTPPYTWSLGGGKKNKMPKGLTLTSDGILGGIPTKAKTATFTVQVTDATYALATKNLSLQIVKGVKFKTKLGKGKVGTPYSATLKATGGIAPLTFSLIGGALPPGLTLDPATGQILGTPTAAGTFNFQVRVASSGGSSNQRSIQIKIK